jgi:hypothetical protein
MIRGNIELAPRPLRRMQPSPDCASPHVQPPAKSFLPCTCSHFPPPQHHAVHHQTKPQIHNGDDLTSSGPSQWPFTVLLLTATPLTNWAPCTSRCSSRTAPTGTHSFARTTSERRSKYGFFTSSRLCVWGPALRVISVGRICTCLQQLHQPADEKQHPSHRES